MWLLRGYPSTSNEFAEQVHLADHYGAHQLLQGHLSAPATVCLRPGRRHRAYLKQLAPPRHAHWARLGLVTLLAYIREQHSVLGKMEEHPFQDVSEAGTNLMLFLPGQNSDFDPLLLGAHYDGPPARDRRR